MSSDYFVIFGAAVRPDGSPSGTLERRTLGALALGKSSRSAMYLATGGQGRYGPPEAEVMKSLLVRGGVPEEQIVLEPNATKTIESIVYCTRILADRGDVGSITVCSSPYHNWRCSILFRLNDIAAQRGAIPSDRPMLGLRKWLYYCLREIVATPVDACLLLFRRMTGRAARERRPESR